ncbi:hypothetical protein BMF89_20525 [Arthrobacter sp. SRS-W-1-2016]|uniref:metallophosphoesterase family protein n=1 Tax=Arthrobacter sp. SRS-W-1-2016 TaxID=1930254 RepID=UPI000990A1B4|nr:metallophosphoesterase [Arthrobacter sp. SRS-W-1-2016]OOP59424.1 hypothetical protein BMF89_20525 [Arthrobacter sp. SRS-W-1-2016]
MTEETRSLPIAVFGDWHRHLGMGLAAIRAAADAGVTTLIHVGDFGVDWPGAERGRYEKRLNALLLERGMTLLVSPGNHDNLSSINLLEVQEDGLISWRSNIKVLPKGGRTVIDGLRVGGLGGAFSVDKARRREGRDWWANEEPTVAQAERLIAGGDLDVLITHDVPAGVPMKPGLDLSPEIVAQADRTRILLRETVDRLYPRHVFCGHWHQRVISEIEHPDGRVTRVDVLASEQSKAGNGVLVYPGEPPLRIEPLLIRGI